MPTPTSITRRGALPAGAAVGAVSALSLLQAGSAHAAPAPRLATANTSRPVLRRGAKGAAVRELQNLLNASGFWLGAVDGDFGHLTQQAVWALQKFHGLSRDGVCGPNTWAAARSRRRPTARKGTGYRIAVDVPKQLLLVVWGSEVRWALNTSTGSGSRFYAWGRWYRAVTSPGTFKVYSTYPHGWQTGALGSMYKPYYYDGGVAVHGSLDIPAYPASHGCCRLSTAAQDMLIANRFLSPGRQVVVY